LHFGLWSLHRAEGRQFGGVGAMVALAAAELSITPAESFTAAGDGQNRVAEFACRWARFHDRSLPGCRIEVRHLGPQHAGLGTGTQLGLSVAVGLNAYCDLPSQSPRELAQSVGRGLRSAVGTYGFVYGGLIVEQGRLPGDPISPLDCRLDLPDAWRFVLLRPRGLCGLAGDEETQALEKLPSVDPATTRDLVAMVCDCLVPAAATADFPMFAGGLYRYGNLAGQCYAARQGGAYNGPVLTALVEWARRQGYAGVGQSSWGPTIFVATESEDAAAELVRHTRDPRLPVGPAGLDVEVVAPWNRGAEMEVCETMTRL
jgi:beta-RFAP synthase